MLETQFEIEAWLLEQPPEHLLAIVFRVALRMWPLQHLHWSINEEVPKSRPSLQCCSCWSLLTLWVQLCSDNNELIEISTSSTEDIYRLSENESGQCFAASHAIANATSVLFSDEPSLRPTVMPAFSALDGEIVFHEVKADVHFLAEGESISNLLLQPPYDGEDHYEADFEAREIFTDTDVAIDKNWRFFFRWYLQLLNRTPLPTELVRRVVTQVPRDIWNAGPKAVAEEIAKIEAQWLTEQAPLAETIALNPDTQKFHLIPTPVQNPPLTTTLVSRVQDALDDAMMGHNGLNERSTIARKLSRTCTRYANDPQRIEMDFTSAATSLRRQMYDTQELPDSEDNLLLLETVEEGVRGIRAAYPDVAENRATLAGLAVQDLSEDDKTTLAQAQPLLDAITEDTLQEDFAQDIPQLLNTSTGPLPNGAPPLPSVDASLRTFTRVSRIKLLIDKIGDWHDGKTHKAATMLLGATGIGKLLYELIQIGLKVLGVL
jgi:hypothetical protein